jgi:hypothetical protein
LPQSQRRTRDTAGHTGAFGVTSGLISERDTGAAGRSGCDSAKRQSANQPSTAPAPPAVAPSPAGPASLPRAESSERRETGADPVSPESDDTVIRRVVATYARAIEDQGSRSSGA